MRNSRKPESKSMYDRVCDYAVRRQKTSGISYTFDNATDELIKNFSATKDVKLPKELASVRPHNINKMRNFVITSLDVSDKKRSDKFAKFLVDMKDGFYAVVGGAKEAEATSEKLNFTVVYI